MLVLSHFILWLNIKFSSEPISFDMSSYNIIHNLLQEQILQAENDIPWSIFQYLKFFY